MVERLGPLPFVWSSGGPPEGWQRELLAMTGVTGPQRFPQGPVRFRRLVVPEVGFRIAGDFHPQHAEFLGRQEPAPASRNRVWLSRKGIVSDRRSTGEQALEAVLDTAGWRIVAPESLDVAEQLAILASSEVVAELEGSAFHAAILLRNPSAPLIVLRRSTSRNYRAIATARGLREIDLFGAFRIVDRKDFTLHRPADWGRIVVELADRLADTPTARARDRLQEEYEASYSHYRRIRRQRWRLVAQARAAVAHHLVPRARQILRSTR